MTLESELYEEMIKNYELKWEPLSYPIVAGCDHEWKEVVLYSSVIEECIHCKKTREEIEGG